ncbi:MAG: C-terminal target protein [Flavipsychrobacter sp.]|nr:C-terminal target protein [Flavipsychrobacter sp.]
MNKIKLLLTLALPVLLCQNAQAQTGSRLTAQADWTHDGAKFKRLDSTSFIFGAEARGGDMTHTHKFDEATMWQYVADSAYVNSMYTTQDFDANNNITTNTKQYWSGTSWVLYARELYTYTTSNKIATMIYQSWGGTVWVPQYKDVYTYDTKGNMILDVYQIWNGLTSKFDNYSQKTYTYDIVTNKLLNETDESLYTGSPVYTEQWVFTYTTDTQLLTTAYNYWSSGWQPSTLRTNTYDVAHNRVSELYQVYNSMTSAWENITYNIYSSFVGKHMPRKQVMQSWNTSLGGSWENSMEYTYTYNSMDQMTSSTGMSWNVVGIFEFAAGDPMARYYYATHGGTTTVKNVTNDNGSANIYPVPASNMLHINLNWNVAQASTIAIYDMTGKMVTPLMNVPSATEYHTAISVNTLAAGTYIVKINGTEGQVVKQIVVAN